MKVCSKFLFHNNQALWPLTLFPKKLGSGGHSIPLSFNIQRMFHVFNKDRRSLDKAHRGMEQSSSKPFCPISVCFVAPHDCKSLLNTRRALSQTTAIFVEPRTGRKKTVLPSFVPCHGEVKTTAIFVEHMEQSLIKK